MKWMGAVKPTDSRNAGNIDVVEVREVPFKDIHPRVKISPRITINCGRNTPDTRPNRIDIKTAVSIKTNILRSFIPLVNKGST